MLKLNKNTVEKVLRTSFALMIGGSLIGTATGCAKEEKETKTLEELFYDDNNEGLDDYFENNVINSEDCISGIINFEKKVTFLKEFNSFLKNPNLNIDFITKLEKQSLSEDINIDDINITIKNFEMVKNFFNSDECKGISATKDQMYNIINDLYKQFLLINKDVKTRKIPTKYQQKEFEINYFGIKLINTIPAELKGLNPENFETPKEGENNYVINYKGTTSETIHVNSDIVKEAISNIYYYQAMDEPENREQYNEDLINKYLDTLERYKIILLAKHKTEVTSHFFTEQEELMLEDNQNIDEIKKTLKR